MSTTWCKHEGSEVLLVEGLDDCHVTLALCAHYHVPENFGIYECGSDSMALARMNALISSSNPPRVIGIVLDADRPDVLGRWQTVRSKLSDYDYVLPDLPDLNGTVVQPVSEVPRLGVWLMPNNQDTGMLENFCGDMIAPEALEVVGQCIAVAEQNNCTTFKEAHRVKAVVHTYLAWQDEPGRPLGQSITAQVLRPDTPSATKFVDWLKTLFAQD